MRVLIEKDLLGHRLKKAREKLRYSQKDAAARLGIHNSTLGKYELGEREPDIETINKIAKFYDVSPQWLIFGDKELNTHLKEDTEILNLIEQEARRLGLTSDDPAFKEMLLDAFKLIRTANRKNAE